VSNTAQPTITLHNCCASVPCCLPADLSTRCLAYESVQQVHLYEPSGHLKQSISLLQDALAEQAQQQGRSIEVKVSVFWLLR
jgi:hypothetical protein